MIDQLPVTWTTISLIDISYVVRGITFPASAKEEIHAPSNVCCLRTSNIQREIEWDDVYFIDRKYVKRDDQFVQTGDVLMSMANSYALVGKVAMATFVPFPTAFGAFLAAIRPTSIVDGKYLFHLLRTNRIQSDLREGSTQTTNIANISVNRLAGIEIPLAPLNEQKRISDKLDVVLARVDGCRDRLDRVPAILKRFRQSVLAAATTGELTEDWRTENSISDEWSLIQLNDVASHFSYGTSAKSSKSGNIPVLRMGNIQYGALDWTDLVYTSDAVEIAKYQLSLGDVLFNRTNSPELVGKTAVFKGEREAIYAGYLIRVRCMPQLLPDYLNYCLGSPAGRQYCWQVKSDGVSQSNINAKKLAAFEFNLPSVDEQTEIVRRVESLFAYADRLEARYNNARAQVEKLTPALLAKAFRGELVPQDPNDEPASELLARIRATKAEKTTKPKRGRTNLSKS